MSNAGLAARCARKRKENALGVCFIGLLALFALRKAQLVGTRPLLLALPLSLVLIPVVLMAIVRGQEKHERLAPGDLWRGAGGSGRELGVMVLRADGLCWEPRDVWRGPRPERRLSMPLEQLECVELGPSHRARPWLPPVAAVRVHRHGGPPLAFDLRHTEGLAAALDRARQAG